MEENKNFDLNTIMEDFCAQIETTIENAIAAQVEDVIADKVEDAVSCSIQDVLEDAMNSCLSRMEFVLPDGTIARTKPKMKLLSPDKTIMLLCHGGLRLDGSTLMVQTSTYCWRGIASYTSREDAIEALSKVKDAMNAEIPMFEL